MILITGGNGQLGSEIRNLFHEYSIDFQAPSSREIDIRDRETVFNYITEMKPTHIIHCAAYTAVDEAEGNGKNNNYDVNVKGTKNIVEAAKFVDATVIFISTDYVFDGRTESEYVTDSITNPINEYGRSKLMAEEITQNTLEKFYIIRTSWVFSEYGKNFVFTMRRLAETNNKLTIVNDQYGRPTWTRTIAEFIQFIIENNPDYGIYHLSNDGSCTWFEFAKEILKNNKSIKLIPVTSDEFPQKATRPKNTVMDLSKTKQTGFLIPSWQDALENMMSNLK